MLDLVRQLVSGPKYRYKQYGYNLDLTYITDRIIAMAFPASGIEKLYRNSIDSVSEFLKLNHRGKYITINISGRPVEQGKLRNVRTYEWEDHKSPQFSLLFKICAQVAEFLAEDEENVAVFHCNHGKGRTGTIICCFFLFMGIFSSSEDVLQFYSQRRFQSEGYGVTQPCQIKYIGYFNQYLKDPQRPQVLLLSKILLKGDFEIKQPYFKFINNQDKSQFFNTKENKDGIILYEKDHLFEAKFQDKQPVYGDVTLQIKENKTIGKNLLISYVFNTSFIQLSQGAARQTIKLKQLSPLGKQKLGNFNPNFQAIIEFREFCKCERKQKCEKCNQFLANQYQQWSYIERSMKTRLHLQSMKLIICFGNKQELEI